MVLGEADGTGKPVIVGLAGRVPVKVTTQNGNISPGDYITTSDIPGVGMKATWPGRVIGKALTWLSGEENGTVIVFIQNTYFDGVNEAEYIASTQSGGLDRFSYMVQQSLGKISALSTSSWTTSTLSGQEDLLTLVDGVDSLTNHIGTLSTSVQQLENSLSGTTDAIATLSGEIALMRSQIVSQSMDSPTTSDDTSVYTSIFSVFSRVLDRLFVQIETVFNEMVTFVKSVVFQGDVTFEKRVNFEDKDISGTAVIPAGGSSVRIDFVRPYAHIPQVVVSSNVFITYRVTNKWVAWFTIQTESPTSQDTVFD